MSNLTALEAYDLVSYSAQFQGRLSAALAGLDAAHAHKREAEWLASAVELIHSSRERLMNLVERSLVLPELAAVRVEHAGVLQGRSVDALEKLLADIMFHAGSRAPVVEALFPRQKLPALRRAKRPVMEAYVAELEKRLSGTYVKRMFAEEGLAFAQPAVDEVRVAFARWKASFADANLPADQAEAMRTEFATAAQGLEAPIRQAKLLAEAALLPLPGAYETSGIGLKPRRRAVKPPTPTPEVAARPPEDARPGMDALPAAPATSATARGRKPTPADARPGANALPGAPATAATAHGKKAPGPRAGKPGRAAAEPV